MIKKVKDKMEIIDFIMGLMDFLGYGIVILIFMIPFIFSQKVGMISLIIGCVIISINECMWFRDIFKNRLNQRSKR